MKYLTRNDQGKDKYMIQNLQPAHQIKGSRFDHDSLQGWKECYKRKNKKGVERSSRRSLASKATPSSKDIKVGTVNGLDTVAILAHHTAILASSDIEVRDTMVTKFWSHGRTACSGKGGRVCASW